MRKLSMKKPGMPAIEEENAITEEEKVIEEGTPEEAMPQAVEPDQSGEDGRAQDPWAPGTFSEFRLRAIGPAVSC